MISQKNFISALLALFGWMLAGAAPSMLADEAPLPPAQTSLDINDAQKNIDHDHAASTSYVLHVEEHGIYEVQYHVDGQYTDDDLGQVRFLRLSDRQYLYTYRFAASARLCLYFPVLDPGEYQVELIMNQCKPGQKFALKLNRFDPVVTDAMKKDAMAALDRGMAFLDKENGNVDWTSEDVVGYEAVVALALVASGDAKFRPWIEQSWLPAAAKRFTESDPDIWNGHSVHGIFLPKFGYNHSLTTLAMAEIAHSFGNQQAKLLAAQGAECLLAAQLTDKKAKKWNGPTAPDKGEDVKYGGWRYTPEWENSDISVSGWCIIALVATNAADIKVEGLRDSLRLAVNYIKRTGDNYSYGYSGHNAGERSAVHAGIGTLICKLYGEESSAIESAATYLDNHLGPGIHVDDGEGYPLYYAYYATRASYLRGGYSWETWRATMIRQILNLQNSDGSWQAFSSEHGERRYAAAMNTMILRMCLNDVPNYLKQEVKGF